MDIGTAKPTAAEQAGIPHAMMDVVSPTEEYSVAQYRKAARAHLGRIWEQNKTPVVVGGTGFYLQALLQPVMLPDVRPDPVFRRQMQDWAEQDGTTALYRDLKEKDPHRAAALYPKDRFRIIRALEIIHHTGRPVPQQVQHSEWPVCWLGLRYADREKHCRVIAERVDAMLAQGWLAEVQALMHQHGADAHALAVAHGYPELCGVVQGKRSLDKAKDIIAVKVRQYARRQRVWFQRNPSVYWLERDTMTLDEMLTAAQNHIHLFLNGSVQADGH